MIKFAQKGFSPIIILTIVGLVFLGFAGYSLYSNNQSSSGKIVASPTPSATPLTATQQKFLKHKENIKAKLNLNDAQFEGLMRMSSDSEFAYMDE